MAPTTEVHNTKNNFEQPAEFLLLRRCGVLPFLRGLLVLCTPRKQLGYNRTSRHLYKKKERRRKKKKNGGDVRCAINEDDLLLLILYLYYTGYLYHRVDQYFIV